MSLRCRLGCHNDELVYAKRATIDAPAVPAQWRCLRCGREKPVGLDNTGCGVAMRFAGHLTAAEVRRITRRTKRAPIYVSPQVEAELKAMAATAQQRKRRGPAEVVNIRKAVG